MREIDFKEGGRALLRTLTAEDIPAADKLRNAAGWNQTPRDWRRLIEFEPDGCFALEVDGRLVGTATATTYGRKAAWIGMMLVHPSLRGRGLGRILMNACIEYLKARRVASIKLDATPLGEPLYKSLGFQVCRQITRMRGKSGKGRAGEVSAGVRQARERDVPAIVRLDKKAFGAERAAVIESLVEDFPERAFVAVEKGSITGVVLGRSGAKACQIGPLIANDDETALKLLRTALSVPPSGECVADVPDASGICRAELEAAGFAVERPFARMCLGPDTARENWDLYRVIHCPELG